VQGHPRTDRGKNQLDDFFRPVPSGMDYARRCGRTVIEVERDGMVDRLAQEVNQRLSFQRTTTFPVWIVAPTLTVRW
jgi:hypothetical protein